MGAGHDFGVGFLIDESGNDVYEAPGLSLGSASTNGMGFFWDKQGDDTYITNSMDSMGAVLWRVNPSLSFRSMAKTVGIFLDTGGKDTFKTPNPDIKNNTSWKAVQKNPPYLLGIYQGTGIDIESPDTVNPR